MRYIIRAVSLASKGKLYLTRLGTTILLRFNSEVLQQLKNFPKEDMKILKVIVMSLPGIACLVIAGILAYSAIESWGWFFVAGVVLTLVFSQYLTFL